MLYEKGGIPIMKKWTGYQKGVNLGGWLSQCWHAKEHYETFITKADIKKIAGWGLDHVRLPIDYNLVEEENGIYKEEGFAYIQRAIDWCSECNLNIILDLHKTAGYSFDDGEQEQGFFEDGQYQERFYRLWEEFARRFGQYKKMLAFELLNEITDKELCEPWNKIANNCIRRIRCICPDIFILVGSYWNNNVTAVKALPLPQDDYIIYNFHCYDPLLFTHQGASLVKDMPEDFRFQFGHTYAEYLETVKQILPDQVEVFPKLDCMEKTFGAEFFLTLFADAVKMAEERNTTLYCGEYGVINHVSAPEALQWHKAIHQAFEYYGIGRAAWNYKELNYGLVDEHFKEVLGEAINYL